MRHTEIYLRAVGQRAEARPLPDASFACAFMGAVWVVRPTRRAVNRRIPWLRVILGVGAIDDRPLRVGMEAGAPEYRQILPCAPGAMGKTASHPENVRRRQ